MTRAKKIESLKPWFHNIYLPDGTQTAPNHPLGDFPRFKWKQIEPHLPQDLTGWKVLDIGCNAGFYSIELAKKGAHVTGIDIDPHYLRQARWVAEQYGLEDKIELHQMQVYDLVKLKGKFDLIWFMGVLYHLRYPLLALDIVTEKVKNLLVFQTLTMPGEEVADTPDDLPITQREMMTEAGWPKMAFIEKRLENDPTNWWAPDKACIEAMFRSCGMKVTSHPGHEIFILEPDKENTLNAQTWNRSEFLSAIGHDWKTKARAKTKEKNTSLSV